MCYCDMHQIHKSVYKTSIPVKKKMNTIHCSAYEQELNTTLDIAPPSLPQMKPLMCADNFLPFPHIYHVCTYS